MVDVVKEGMLADGVVVEDGDEEQEALCVECGVIENVIMKM